MCPEISWCCLFYGLWLFFLQFAVTDCYDVKQSGKPLPGVYEIGVDSETSVKVQCDQQGYTVIQSRGQFGNPKDYFSGNWSKYKIGFGEPGK